MAALAVTDLAPVEAGGQPAPERHRPGRGRRRRRWPIWRYAVLGAAACYFLVPLYAALRYCIDVPGHGVSAAAFRDLVHQQGFGAAFGLSLRLAVVATAITLALMVPTAVYVHLRAPGLRRLMDAVTTLPIVIPPIVLILGVLQVAPPGLKATPYLLALEYVVLAMPFAYRSLDAGLRAIDLRTLTEASRALGGSWPATLRKVVLPNMRAALLSATVLTTAMVLGEFTMASLDQYQTFPVWIVAFDQDNSRTSVAASLMALLVTWACLLAISLLGRRRRTSTGDAGGAGMAPIGAVANASAATGMRGEMA